MGPVSGFAAQRWLDATAMVRAADVVTVATPAFADVYRGAGARVRVDDDAAAVVKKPFQPKRVVNGRDDDSVRRHRRPDGARHRAGKVVAPPFARGWRPRHA
jgi:hypothetical protein